ncbi:MAG: glycosyltransferase, partial [Longimicrobiales bacterium]
MQRSPRVVIVIPVYNDWEAAGRVIAGLGRALAGAASATTILLVDDGSSQGAPSALAGVAEFAAVEVLALRRNLGHQRAIGVALAWIEKHRPCDAVVIMDGDGEDDPADVPRLLAGWEELGGHVIVFAERTRRSEGLVFRISYMLFKMVHRLLTGLGVRVGNFSVMPYGRLRALTTVPDLWNHYAAAVFISRLPFTAIPTVRAKRLAGRSSMN